MVVIINKKKFLILIAIVTILSISTIYNYSIGAFKTMNEPYEKGNNEGSKYVAITCNVDWGNEYIEDMLNILHDNNVHITFMVTGRWADKYPDLLLKIKKSGHEIGNHGFKHLDYAKLDYENNYKEIEQAKQTIENIIGERTIFFSPPSGSFNKHTLEAASNLDYITVKWNIDTADWLYKDNPTKIIERVKSKNMEDNSIVLIHPTKATVETLESIIDIIIDRGYKVGKLSNIFKVN
ncbi:polysaccharide deacetylase family protein [Alkalithermobacter paradoxus]|uniref:Peptidoglycan-N-acetylmuramic acid deacetylase PdaC n=1 Tax=Alkalithermobacter paradoxus TaxID=29349 RepID=A0A1V4IAX6_9FIRM|nr:peptidoglycan-N-acetylmuramic acid deacetylase PdaC [[Clostridium] thermoalcaliphilum]